MKFQALSIHRTKTNSETHKPVCPVMKSVKPKFHEYKFQ